MIDTVVRSSITGRAIDAGLFMFETIDIRDHAVNAYGKVDDSLYGGGTGMLMMCQPIYDAWQRAWVGLGCQAVAEALADGADHGSTDPVTDPSDPSPHAPVVRTLYMSPKGRPLDQSLVRELSTADHLIILCGHYEGVDQRVLDELQAEEVSLGDFVLTGGELAACAVVDSVARLLPGVLPSEDAYEQESHYDGRLECRQFTKPAEWKGRGVPEVLMGGHHKKIAEWRSLDGLAETLAKRPDLFQRLELDAEEYAELADHIRSEGR